MDISKVGNTIKTRRETENITQEELCNGICTASTLSRIEALGMLKRQRNLELMRTALLRSVAAVFLICYVSKLGLNKYSLLEMLRSD